MNAHLELVNLQCLPFIMGRPFTMSPVQKKDLLPALDTKAMEQELNNMAGSDEVNFPTLYFLSKVGIDTEEAAKGTTEANAPQIFIIFVKTTEEVI